MSFWEQYHGLGSIFHCPWVSWVFFLLDDNETLRKAEEEEEEEEISGDDEPWSHYKAELERSFEEEPVMVNRIASGHSEPSSENSEPAPLRLGKAFLTVYVHNQPEVAILDSGSDTVIFPERLISSQPVDQRVLAINNTELQVSGRASVQFRIGDRGYEVDCIVSPSIPEIILGFPFLLEAEWNFTKQQIRLNGRWLDLEQKRPTSPTCGRLVVMEMTTPARDETYEGSTPVVCLTPTRDQPSAVEAKPPPGRQPTTTTTSDDSPRDDQRDLFSAKVVQRDSRVPPEIKVIRWENWIISVEVIFALLSSVRGYSKMSNWDDIDANELRAAGDGNNTLLQDERDGDDQVTVAYSPVSFQDAIMEEEVETSDAPEVPSAPIVVNDPGTTHPTDIEPTASAVSVSSVMEPVTEQNDTEMEFASAPHTSASYEWLCSTLPR